MRITKRTLVITALYLVSVAAALFAVFSTVILVEAIQDFNRPVELVPVGGGKVMFMGGGAAYKDNVISASVFLSISVLVCFVSLFFAIRKHRSNSPRNVNSSTNVEENNGTTN